MVGFITHLKAIFVRFLFGISKRSTFDKRRQKAILFLDHTFPVKKLLEW